MPVGRPRKYDAKRHNFTMRMTSKMHAEIKRRAEEDGRSMSEEVELLLEKIIFPLVVLDWD